MTQSNLSISYELCKELKDAGFPQSELNQYCVHNEYMAVTELHRGGYEVMNAITHQLNCPTVSFPTLSELIEACGDRFIMIYQVKNKDTKSDIEFDWFSKGYFEAPKPHCNTCDCNYRHEEYKKFKGSNPKEAVAKLWLELNKKV